MRKMISILSFIFTFSAHAGPFSSIMPLEKGDVVPGSGSTGGGYVVFCPANEVEGEFVQLLDLYEAKQTFGFELVNSSGNAMEDYYRSADRTYTLQGSPHLGEDLKEDIINNYKKVMRSIEFVENKKDLPYVDDVGKTPWIPSSCELQQVALFIDFQNKEPQKIIILKPLWDMLSPLDKAALVSHELAGHWYRIIGEKNTEAARNFVAHIYAKNPGPSLWHGLGGNTGSVYNKHTSGETPEGFQLNSGFYLDQKYPDRTRLQFDHLFGRAVLVKTYVDLPKFEWKMKREFLKIKPYSICLLASQNVDLHGTVPVHGTMGKGYQFQYTIKTGEPIKFALIRDNLIVARNKTVSFCN